MDNNQPPQNPQQDPQPQTPAADPNRPRRPLIAIDTLFGREVKIETVDVPMLGPLFRRPRKQKIVNLSATMSGPPSPGPSHAPFDLDNMADHDRNRRANLPLGHPYRITLGKYHPNTLRIPALQSVRSLGHHAKAVKEGSCFEENTNWAAKTSCRERTSDICVDLSHGEVTYLCNRCHDKARQVVGRAVISIAKSLRAYACYICAITLDADRFANSQFNVWGLPLDALDGKPSISRGPPQPMTGCMCGTKLMDHTLCTPHRAHHFLEVRAKANALRAFVVATFGQMVCPFCNLNPGADTTNFLDQQGNPFPKVAYLCMACLGWVVADAATHPTIDAPSWDNARLLLELQQ